MVVNRTQMKQTLTDLLKMFKKKKLAKNDFNLEKALVLNSKLLITYMFYVIMKRFKKKYL